MPSYADEYAARFSRSKPSHNGPIRLVMSRGDSRRGPDGQVIYNEKWDEEDEEEGMDMETLNSLDSERHQKAHLAIQRVSSRSPSPSMGDILSAARRAPDNWRGGCTLLVLDTNVLMSTLPFVKALFEQCLSRNVSLLQGTSIAPSPLALIMPRVVLSELDGLKKSTMGNAGRQARAANQWILAAMRSQKKQTYETKLNGDLHRETIPENYWILHIENAAHVDALERMRKSPSPLSNDEEIVRVCVALRSQTGLEVCFCSDDTNARTIAEAEGLATFSFTILTEGIGGNERALKRHADELIEQWTAQGQTQSRLENEIVKMDEDVDVDFTILPSTTIAPRVKVTQSSPVPQTRVTRSNRFRTTQHSIHAIAPSSRSQQAPYQRKGAHPSTSPIKSDHKHRSARQDISRRLDHIYPKDRSTSSSIWAIRK